MLEYQINAIAKAGGMALSRAEKEIAIPFDAAAESGTLLPNPAELFLTSFAACILKNVERYSQKLKIPYTKAEITVNGIRSDVPPAMVSVEYELRIFSNAEARKVDLLYRNVKKFGTIFNTVSKSCEVNGKMKQCLPDTSYKTS
jgi:uncharacterized OsmC-like protein